MAFDLIQYSVRFLNRRSPLRRSRWKSIYRSGAIFLFIFSVLSFVISLFYTIFIFQSNSVESHSSDIIVSLTSTPERFRYELPFAIHSLLSQTRLPKQIRIYLSPTAVMIQQRNLTLKHLKTHIKSLDSSKTIEKFFDKLVKIQFEQEDYGPATKFLPIIKEFKSKTQPIVICDDDQYYHPYTLSTLIEYSTKYKNSIVGLRGWRVREDLIWGVGGLYEMSYHIIESQYLADVYRVGILTANHAYLIRPSFFDFHIYQDFNQVPDDIRHVDDIWLNGQAAKRHIDRYVVPTCCSHIEVTRTHALEQYLEKNKMDRFSANNHALQWFSSSWETDLWYKFKGENRPRYRRWLTMIYREWINLILKLKFIVYFGFI